MCLNYRVKTTTIECKSLGNASYSDKQLAGNIMTTDCYQHTTRPVKQLLELSNYNKQCKKARTKQCILQNQSSCI